LFQLDSTPQYSAPSVEVVKSYDTDGKPMANSAIGATTWTVSEGFSEWLSENFHQLKPPLFGNGIQAETPG